MVSVARRQETSEEAIARLETFMHRMERRYECTSTSALEAVRAGTLRETAEVAKWLTAYRTLLRLKEAVGLPAL